MWVLFLIFFTFISPVHAQELQESTVSSQEIPTIETEESSPSSSSMAAPNLLDPQTALFQQYRTDYLFQFDLYQKAYIDYINKSQVHTKYNTVTTQKDKFEATKNTLLIRNKMFKTYLVALRVDLDRFKESNPTETEKNQIKISKWEDWFDEQNLIIPSFNNESDTSKWVNKFKTNYVAIQKDIYTALVQHEINFKLKILDEVKSLAEEIQNSPQLPTESQQWFTNLPIKSDLIMENLKNAISYTEKVQNLSKFSNFYTNSKNEINKANNYLIDIMKDLKSIAIKLNQ